MLPSFQCLARERSLLLEVLRAAPHTCEASPRCANNAAAGFSGAEPARQRYLSVASGDHGGTLASGDGACEAVGDVAEKLAGFDGLQRMPQELLVDIARDFLASPVWHSCQLGEASANLGKVFLDEALWADFLKHRFARGHGKALRRSGTSPGQSPKRQRTREVYAQLHQLEARFRGGTYGARGMLDNPRAGAPVLDIRVAPPSMGSAAPYSAAFAALRDGSVAVYDLGQLAAEPDVTQTQAAPRLKAVRLLSPGAPGGSSLCVMPVGGRREASPLLVAGFSLGRLACWNLPSGQLVTPESWEIAHQGRVTSLAAVANERALLSAASDGVVKAWSLEDQSFGNALETFAGHGSAVISVASSPVDERLFMTGGQDRTLRLWDRRESGTRGGVARWSQQDWATCVEFHPYEVAFLSSDKAIYQWDLRVAGGDPLHTTHRHRKLISSFRSDPLRLVSCSLDGCVKVSSLEDPEVRVASPTASPTLRPAPDPTPPGMAADGEDVYTFRSSADYVLCTDFDETCLLAGNVDGTVDVYDFDAARFEPKSSKSSQAGVPRGRCGEFAGVQLDDLPGPIEAH